MYRHFWILPLVFLTGCATSNQPVATCTNLISTGGGLLQFCQSNDKVQVSESGVDASPGSTDVRIVNDPVVLKSLQQEITPRPELQRSRNIVAHACVVKGNSYVNIAMTDLKRLISSTRAANSVGTEPKAQ